MAIEGEGGLERRSMVYSEYFVRGSEPTTVCDQHPTRGFLTAIAGAFGASHDRPAPPHVDDAGLVPPPSSTATAGTQTDHEPPPAPAPPQKKRGFWSRIFGRSNSSDQDAASASTRKKGG